MVVGAFGTVDLMAQTGEKAVNPVKGVGVVIKHNPRREAGPSQVTLCFSTDTPAASDRMILNAVTSPTYRLKVWQLKQDSAGAKVRRVYAELYVEKIDGRFAVKNNAAELVSDAETIKSCTESLVEPDNASQRHSIRSKGAGGEEVRAIAANLSPCDNERSCEFEWTLEAIGTNGKPIGSEKSGPAFKLVKNGSEWNIVPSM